MSFLLQVCTKSQVYNLKERFCVSPIHLNMKGMLTILGFSRDMLPVGVIILATYPAPLPQSSKLNYPRLD